MTSTEIKEQITLLEAENKAIDLKLLASGSVGAVVGIYLAKKNKKSFWQTIGYSLAGSIVAKLPIVLVYASKLSENDAKINNYNEQLKQLETI